jgi:hypothetical protein
LNSENRRKQNNLAICGKKMYLTYGVWVLIRSKLNHVKITAHLAPPTIRTKNQIVER